jgi:hypothetical protein
MKVFVAVYLLLLFSGSTLTIAVLDHHVSQTDEYRFTDVYQQNNEYIANLTLLTFFKDVYFYKTVFVGCSVWTWTIARGTNASQVLQDALDQGGLITFHSGTYILSVGLWVINDTLLIGEDVHLVDEGHK